MAGPIPALTAQLAKPAAASAHEDLMLYRIARWPACRSGSGRSGALVATSLEAMAAYCFSISHAAAEVCDKVGGGAEAAGFAVVLAGVGALLVAAFGWPWPSYVASALLVLPAAGWGWDFASGDGVAVAAWREGCEPAGSLLFLAGAVAAIVLGRAADRFRRSRFRS